MKIPKLVLVPFLSLWVAFEAPAATFTVSKAGDTNDGLCDADCSLREAVIAANGSPGLDTIEIPANTYVLQLSGNDAAAATGDLDLSESVTIQGSGSASAIIRGDGSDRVFEVVTISNPNVMVDISGVAIENGSSVFGGGIFNPSGGTLTLSDVIVRSNSASNGGGILNDGSLTLTNTTISGNVATASSPTTGFGGGIQNNAGATLTVMTSTVSGNTADRDGGGLWSQGTATLNQSTFDLNQSGAVGGAVANVGDLNVTASSFDQNTADDGGAIGNLTGATITISQSSSFTGNRADGVDLGGGGALFNFQGTMSVADSSLTGNTAKGEGGGGIETNGELTLTNTTITGNLAELHDGSSLPANTSPGLGGGLLVIAGSVVNVSGSVFDSNVAGTSGGAIYNDQNATLGVTTNSTLSNNSAQSLFGGGILNEGTLTVMNSTLEMNDAELLGGGISNAVGTTTLTNVMVMGNSSRDSGGGLYNLGSAVTASNSTIGGNDAVNFGGGVLNEGQMTFTNSVVSDNTAVSSGGGIFSVASATFDMTGGEVRANQAGDNGGGLWNEGEATLTLVAFTQNTATNSAGGIGNLAGALTVTDSTISGSTAGNGAGLGNFSGGTVEITGSTVSGNMAGAAGAFGGGMLNDQGAVTITNSTLSGNSSADAGGGISNNSALASVSLTNVTISANVANSGDAIFNFEGTVMAVNSIVDGSCNNLGTIDSNGGNIESPGDTCRFGGGPGDQVNVANVMLEPLSSTVGPTETHALGDGSPALEAGLNASCPVRDQRGVLRPFDWDGDGMAVCDVGAVELPEPALQLMVAMALAAVLLLRCLRSKGTANRERSTRTTAAIPWARGAS